MNAISAKGIKKINIFIAFIIIRNNNWAISEYYLPINLEIKA